MKREVSGYCGKNILTIVTFKTEEFNEGTRLKLRKGLEGIFRRKTNGRSVETRLGPYGQGLACRESAFTDN